MSDLQQYEDVAPNLRNHPMFSGSQSVGMISGENPRWLDKLPLRHQERIKKWGHKMMGDEIKRLGLRAEETEGRYGDPEKSWIVYGPTKEQLVKLGTKYGQDSVLHIPAGHKTAKIHYTDLAQDDSGNSLKGHYRPALGTYGYHPTEQPEDYYTKLPGKGYIRLDFDWDKPPINGVLK